MILLIVQSYNLIDCATSQVVGSKQSTDCVQCDYHPKSRKVSYSRHQFAHNCAKTSEQSIDCVRDSVRSSGSTDILPTL